MAQVKKKDQDREHTKKRKLKEKRKWEIETFMCGMPEAT